MSEPQTTQAPAPTRKRVAVIGAGVSGLAAGRAFKARGHDVTILERAQDLGGVWDPARSYPEVQTQSPKDLYRYTSKPMPDAFPEWPKGPQVHAYLSEFAAENALGDLIRYGTAVETMARREDGAPGWTLTLKDDAGQREESYDFVAVCTGQFSEKNRLAHPGMEAFEAAGGRVLHSSEYNDAGAVKDRDVVVLGFSKS
ncbi:MAG: NAD(P)/FAD-dependent oxidoreductase, partial [Pseudomonadota bacterium]